MDLTTAQGFLTQFVGYGWPAATLVFVVLLFLVSFFQSVSAWIKLALLIAAILSLLKSIGVF